ncbi:segregation/condensation protein A [Candidatus Uhrbacteria bacterium]|nr:segregation/condensation protein A [Candidatus Uhrbacteria bacterium]
MPYDVVLPAFAGPLPVLLDLIERAQLPITEVSLAQVADDYLRFIQANDVPAEELADFLVVAAKLLLIKSHAILPVLAEAEVDADPGKLALQLRLYREFVGVSQWVEERYASEEAMLARPHVPLPVERGFVPPESLGADALRESFRHLLKRLEPFLALKEASLRRVISVQEKIRDIQRAVFERARLAFADLVGPRPERADVVVSFLAVLELVKQRIVSAAQASAFEDITLKRLEF